MDHLSLEAKQLKTAILKKYVELSNEYGLSKVLLDQVAAQLSISKKTIYKLFTSKEEIISACIDDVFSTIDAEVVPIMSDPTISIIDKITMLLPIVANHLTFFSQQHVIELQRSFPEMWNKILDMRQQKISRYEALFELAIEQGIIINIDPKLIVHLLLSSIEAFTNENFLKEHNISYSQSLKLVNSILLNGILKK